MSSEKKWLQLTISCDAGLSDSLSDYLVGVLEAGVEIGVDDQLINQTLHAFLEESDPSAERIAEVVRQVEEQARMLAEIFSVEIPSVSYQIIDDQDWGNNWKKHFKPFAITEGLVIKPTWEEYSPEEGVKVIEMDPGMAFGTGHHATTSLCMDYIREAVKHHPGKVLDVGTGTGILAMAAALFGSHDVLGIDNDPEAVLAATENVEHNGLQDTVSIEITPLEELEGEYSLVVANIIHDVLIMMKDDLSRLTATGGSLVLSGILREGQADNISAVFEEAGFSCQDRDEKGEWAALKLVKR